MPDGLHRLRQRTAAAGGDTGCQLRRSHGHRSRDGTRERLSIDEIATLAGVGFPDEETLLYLKSGNAVYSLKAAQIDEMRAAGVSDPVIDYMLSTPQRGNPARALWPGQRNNQWRRGHTRGVH